MPMTATSFVPHEMKSSIIKVTSYEEKNLEGYFINPYFEKEIYFQNMTQLLFLMTGMHDQLSFPQESMKKRGFVDTKGLYSIPNKYSPQEIPILASFKIDVLFRQNASWQGNVVWIEGAAEAQFRSMCELVFLMDAVLSEPAQIGNSTRTQAQDRLAN